MRDKTYPLLSSEYVLVCRYGSSIIYPLYTKEEYYSAPDYAFTTLNRTAAEILSLCDGQHSIESIIGTMSDKYNEDKETATSFIEQFLDESVMQGHIRIEHAITQYKTNVYGDFSLAIPITACIEITKRCPLSCKHCYNKSGSAKATEMSTEEVFFVIDTLHELGIQKVMITGGEPTQRSDFLDIIGYAYDRFMGISIASNGYLITEEMSLSLSSLKSKIVVQISIDGNEEHHNDIRGAGDSFERATKAIQYLHNCEIPVIVSSTLNANNFGDMEEIAQISYSLGALQLAFALTTDQGRARENRLAYNLDIQELVQRALFLKKKYQGRMHVQIEDDTLNKLESAENTQCPAGKSQIAIRENGDVAPCLCFFYSYGNMLTDDLKDIFDPRKSAVFENLPMPNQDFCGDCEELENCNRCPARAFDAQRKDCKWKIQFSDAVAEFSRGT